MCFILGTINRSFAAPELDVIKHREPDDFGMESIVVMDNMVQFGQRCLSILDLSHAGHQSVCEVLLKKNMLSPVWPPQEQI